MAANSLFPAFVRITYHSPFGIHIMTLPTLPFNNADPGVVGQFDTWNAVGIDGDLMVDNLVTELAKQYQAGDATFDSFDVFTLANATADPEWRYGGALAVPGSSLALIGWRQAVQATFTFRTTLAGIMRLVLLDKPTNNAFGRYTVPGPDEATLIAQISSVANGWAGRDGGRPLVFKNVTIKTNDRLRREYGIG